MFLVTTIASNAYYGYKCSFCFYPSLNRKNLQHKICVQKIVYTVQSYILVRDSENNFCYSCRERVDFSQWTVSSLLLCISVTPTFGGLFYLFLLPVADIAPNKLSFFCLVIPLQCLLLVYKWGWYQTLV